MHGKSNKNAVATKKSWSQNNLAKKKISIDSAQILANNSDSNLVLALVIIFTFKKFVIFDKTILLNSKSMLFFNFNFHN